MQKRVKISSVANKQFKSAIVSSVTLGEVVSPGWILSVCYKGRETTASYRLLCHRACAPT